MARTGVLVTGFGGPDSLDAVAPFMCNLMGRDPSDELVETGVPALSGDRRLVAARRDRRLDRREARRRAERRERGLAGRSRHALLASVHRGRPGAAQGRSAATAWWSCRSRRSSPRSRPRRIARRSPRRRSRSRHRGRSRRRSSPTLPDYAGFFASSIAAALVDIEPNEGAIIAFTAHSLPGIRPGRRRPVRHRARARRLRGRRAART